jgi:hypothetical protein
VSKHKHEKTKQGYGAISYLRLVLKKLKIMEGTTFIYIVLNT